MTHWNELQQLGLGLCSSSVRQLSYIHLSHWRLTNNYSCSCNVAAQWWQLLLTFALDMSWSSAAEHARERQADRHTHTHTHTHTDRQTDRQREGGTSLSRDSTCACDDNMCGRTQLRWPLLAGGRDVTVTSRRVTSRLAASTIVSASRHWLPLLTTANVSSSISLHVSLVPLWLVCRPTISAMFPHGRSLKHYQSFPE